MNKIAKNFLINGLSSISGQIIAFITITYYAKIIDIDYFGSITLAQQIILYFAMTVLFGLQTLGIRMISNKESSSSEAIGEIVAFRLLVAVICFVIVVIGSFFINKGTYFDYLLVIFALTLFPLALNLDWFFNGIQEMQHNAVFNLCKNLIPAVFIFFLLSSTKNIFIIPWATFVGLLAGNLYHYYIVYFKHGVRFKLRIEKKIITRYIKYGSPFLVSGLLSMVNNNVDKLIIGFTIADRELGIYQAAYTFISFLISIEALIFTPFFPRLMSLYNKGDEKALGRLTSIVVKIVAIIILPIFAGGIILSKDIISSFFSTEYLSAYIPLNILLFYIFILYFREIYAYQMNAWHLEGKYLKTVAVSAILNLVLCIIFIPVYGISAAAVVTTVTEIINFIMMRYYSNKIMYVRVLEVAKVIIVPAAAMSMITFGLRYLQVPLLANIFISAVSYILFLVMFKIIGKEEIRSLIIRKEVL